MVAYVIHSDRASCQEIQVLDLPLPQVQQILVARQRWHQHPQSHWQEGDTTFQSAYPYVQLHLLHVPQHLRDATAQRFRVVVVPRMR